MDIWELVCLEFVRTGYIQRVYLKNLHYCRIIFQIQSMLEYETMNDPLFTSFIVL